MSSKKAEWVLRIAVAGEFLGHGMFALAGKPQWVGWIGQMLGTTPETSSQLLTLIGYSDIAVAAIVLIYPVSIVLLWAALWGFWTALVRPLVGESWLDFIERFATGGRRWLFSCFMAGRGPSLAGLKLALDVISKSPILGA